MSGALSARPGAKQQTYVCEPLVMASAAANAEIGRGGVAPTLMARMHKQAPILCAPSRATGRTSSARSAQGTATTGSGGSS